MSPSCTSASEAGKKSKRTPSFNRSVRELLANDPSLSVDLLVKAAYKHALKGKAEYMKFIREALDGNTQSIEVSGPDGKPMENKVTVEFVKADAVPGKD